MVALLDVNFLVALFHPRHVHHSPAHAWFNANSSSGWATCPVTVNGAVRVLSNASAGLLNARPVEVARRLRVLCEHPNHYFWPEGPSLLDAHLFQLEFLQGYRRVTDIYLLALAVLHDGRLVTFDSAIPLRAVKAAMDSNLVIL